MSQMPDGNGLLQSQTDEQLMLSYRAGRLAAFDELVRRYERELYNYLRRYLGDRTLAEDVFQHTILQLHLKRELYQPGLRIRPWLYTIATHQAIDMLRRVGRETAMVSLDARASSDAESQRYAELIEGTDPEPLDELQDAERREWVRHAVRSLPDYLRRVVELAYFRGLKHREIAKLLEIPIGTVKSRMHAAMARLGQMWNDEEGSRQEQSAYA